MKTSDGFKFKPTEDEIIDKFLKRKVAGHEPVQWNPHLVQRNLYGDGAEPWNVLPDDHPCWRTLPPTNSSYTVDVNDVVVMKNVKKVVYVFTTLNRKAENDNGSRFDRTAGCGTWEGKSKPKPIVRFDDSTGMLETIGTMKSFRFKVDEKKIQKNYERCRLIEEEKENWIMHEYALHKETLRFCMGRGVEKRTVEETVLCAIFRSYQEDVNVANHTINSKKRPSSSLNIEEEEANKKHKYNNDNYSNGFSEMAVANTASTEAAYVVPLRMIAAADHDSHDNNNSLIFDEFNLDGLDFDDKAFAWPNNDLDQAVPSQDNKDACDLGSFDNFVINDCDQYSMDQIWADLSDDNQSGSLASVPFQDDLIHFDY